MPLTRSDKEFFEAEEGIVFVMADEGRNAKNCIVGRKALRDLAQRLRLPDSDSDLFARYRELIEQIASDAYDAEMPGDEEGRVVVTSEAIARVMRSAY